MINLVKQINQKASSEIIKPYMIYVNVKKQIYNGIASANYWRRKGQEKLSQKNLSNSQELNHSKAEDCYSLLMIMHESNRRLIEKH